MADLNHGDAHAPDADFFGGSKILTTEDTEKPHGESTLGDSSVPSVVKFFGSCKDRTGAAIRPHQLPLLKRIATAVVLIPIVLALILRAPVPVWRCSPPWWLCSPSMNSSS